MPVISGTVIQVVVGPEADTLASDIEDMERARLFSRRSTAQRATFFDYQLHGNDGHQRREPLGHPDRPCDQVAGCTEAFVPADGHRGCSAPAQICSDFDHGCAQRTVSCGHEHGPPGREEEGEDGASVGFLIDQPTDPAPKKRTTNTGSDSRSR